MPTVGNTSNQTATQTLTVLREAVVLMRSIAQSLNGINQTLQRIEVKKR